MKPTFLSYNFGHMRGVQMGLARPASRPYADVGFDVGYYLRPRDWSIGVRLRWRTLDLWLGPVAVGVFA